MREMEKAHPRDAPEVWDNFWGTSHHLPLHASSALASASSHARSLSYPEPAKRSAFQEPIALEHCEEDVLVYRKDTSTYFLRWYFGSRLKILEVSKPSENRIYESYDFGDSNGTIICSKLESRNGGSGGWKSKGFPSLYVKAYYLVSVGPERAQTELEKLANFEELPACKVASRMELLTSPAITLPDCKSGNRKCHYHLQQKIFKLIPERSNLGCGFISRKFLRELLGDGTHARETAAIQVRIVGPNLGIFKGVLMVKRQITGIHLPPSMKKVKKSKHKGEKAFKGVHLLVNGIFPTRTAKQMGKKLNPLQQDPVSSALKSSGDLSDSNMIQQMLVTFGAPHDVIKTYAIDSNKSWARRNHAWCVGVADPTEALPPGHVFVTGFGVGPASRNDRVFMTRSPCTEQGDARLLPVVRSKPATMSDDDWSFLSELHFGLVIFAHPEEGEMSIPEQLAMGDCDGDKYYVLWDPELLSTMVEPALVTMEPIEKDDLIGVTFTTNVNGSTRLATVVSKRGGLYSVSISIGAGHCLQKDFSREDILQDREFINRIESHRGSDRSIEVKIVWSNGKSSWQRLTGRLRKEASEVLTDYAISQDLLETSGWEWVNTEEFIEHVLPEKVIGHQGKGKNTKLHVLWMDKTDTWEPLFQMQNEDIVADYAKENGLLGRKEFAWARAHQKRSWFANVQEILCDGKRLVELDSLRTTLYNRFQKMAKSGGTRYDVEVLGRAYKQSSDIGKHGGEVELPYHLRPDIRNEKLHKYFVWGK